MSLPRPSSKTIGLAVLSWKSPLTVKASLQTYIDRNLFSLFDDAVICFQEIDETDIALANEMKIRYAGSPVNTGIQGGFRMANESLDTDYIIVLENDMPMTTSLESAEKQISDCIQLLEDGVIDMARLRSRFNPGEQFRAAEIYSTLFPVRQPHSDWADTESIDTAPPWLKWLRRNMRPGKARKWSGRSVYIEQYPERIFPKIINRQQDYLIVDSSALPWTNQATLISRKLMGELLDYADNHPSSRTVNGMQDFEKALNCKYWKKRHFRIAVTPGIFTHMRLDR